MGLCKDSCIIDRPEVSDPVIGNRCSLMTQVHNSAKDQVHLSTTPPEIKSTQVLKIALTLVFAGNKSEKLPPTLRRVQAAKSIVPAGIPHSCKRSLTACDALTKRVLETEIHVGAPLIAEVL